jgi:hypothetical protein
MTARAQSSLVSLSAPLTVFRRNRARRAAVAPGQHNCATKDASTATVGRMERSGSRDLSLVCRRRQSPNARQTWDAKRGNQRAERWRRQEQSGVMGPTIAPTRFVVLRPGVSVSMRSATMARVHPTGRRCVIPLPAVATVPCSVPTSPLASTFACNGCRNRFPSSRSVTPMAIVAPGALAAAHRWTSERSWAASETGKVPLATGTAILSRSACTTLAPLRLDVAAREMGENLLVQVHALLAILKDMGMAGGTCKMAMGLVRAHGHSVLACCEATCRRTS